MIYLRTIAQCLIMEKSPEGSDTKKQITGRFTQLQKQPARQEISNVYLNHSDKVKEYSFSLKNISKVLTGFVQKTKSFISDVSLRKYKTSAPTPGINTSIAAKILLLAQHLKLPGFVGPADPLQRTLRKKQDDNQHIDIIDKEIIMKLQNALSSPRAAGGARISNHKGEFLGRIKKLTYNDEKKIQYIILNCTKFFGRRNRYFAVPASSTLLGLSDKGKVIIRLNKNDLKLAKGISANKCPEPSLRFGLSIYELYNYNNPSDKKTETNKQENN